MKAPEIVKTLVKKFENNINAYKSGKYNETTVRQEFIDPFFKALGWDVNNEINTAPQYRDVILEDSIKVGSKTKAPDYSFTLHGRRIFFLEAKKPSIDIINDKDSVFQLKRYVWSAKLKLSVLTDFEDLAIYEAKNKPARNDNTKIGRVKLYNYKDYIDKWDEIYNLLSKDAILNGSFDKFAENTSKKGTSLVDEEFLKEIEEWRLILARNIAIRNPEISINELNYTVQQTIDRIIFLRIAEDKGIEPYEQLLKLLDNENIYNAFGKLCLDADSKYNAGIFHFKEEKEINQSADEFTLNLKIDNDILKKIIKNLYYPKSPYEFSVLSPEILGNVYEQFLGKIIRLTKTHQAKIEEKPEVKKAGGVFYTPQYIVDYIVKNTIETLCKNKTPQQVAKLKIVDPACGSGSFLLGAYEYLLNWHINYYSKLERPPKDTIYQSKKKEYHLTIKKKKEILLNNIYGVDIDNQAVEVTKLSLLLKVLEDANKDLLETQQKLYKERVLPFLGENIKAGNSLIGTDIIGIKNIKLNQEEITKINPFDWQEEFKEIMKDGGFDAVIGNPPYVSWSNIKNREYFEEGRYLNLKYKCRPNHNDAQPNLYAFFMTQSLSLVKKMGLISFILPQEWLYQIDEFRDYFLENSGDITIIKFAPNFKVFKTKDGVVGTNSLIIFLTNNEENSFNFAEIEHIELLTVQNILKNNSIQKKSFSKNRFNGSRWEIYHSIIENLLKKFDSNHINFDNSEFFKVIGGFQPPIELSKKFIVDNSELNLFDKNELKNIFPCIYNASDIQRYFLNNSNDNWVILNGLFDTESEFQKNCPNIYKFLYDRLDKKKTKWWEFPNVRNLDIFKLSNEKILSPRTASKNSFCLDDKKHIFKGTNSAIVSLLLSPKYVLSLLNSKLATFWYREYGYSYHGGDNKKFEPSNLKNYMIPIVNISIEKQKPFIELVEKISKLNEDLSKVKTPHEIKLLEKQIQVVDKKIDELVYDLYELNEEEIAIIK
jgi:hypothetical protein